MSGAGAGLSRAQEFVQLGFSAQPARTSMSATAKDRSICCDMR